LKIALIDPNHFTRGVHTNTVPLGLGLLATYVKKVVDANLEFKIFKDAEKALDAFKSWNPDVLGIAMYSWNSYLGLRVSELTKEKFPNCLTVVGGPDLETSNEKRREFLSQNSWVDICVEYDGEIPFAELIKRLTKGESVKELKSKEMVGAYSLHPETQKLVFSTEKPLRLKTLDVFGSMYSDGIFDSLLDDGFHPFVQTHRGCPFECTFCHTSDSYYTKMLFMSPEIFKKDMDVLGRRFAGKHNVTLYMANTNMSMFKEDIPIAKIIRETQKEYDWPRLINVNSGKDPKKLISMLDIIKFQPTIALQTLTVDVLKNIKRKNISFKRFVEFQQEAMEKTGETSTTELILCLPDETKETFMETLKVVLNSGVQNIAIYTLMNLKGTPLAFAETSEKYGYELRHRVVPRQFSVLGGKKILDTEEVVVATNTMSYKDYLDLRGLSFTVTSFFGSTELIPIKKVLLQHNVDIADWIFRIHNRLPEYEDIYGNYMEFIKETEKELFRTKEELFEYFNQDDKYKDLCDGKYGDNLLRKYRYLVIHENFDSYLKLASEEATKLLMTKIDEDTANSIVADLVEFVSTRNMKKNFTDNSFLKGVKRKLLYDVPLWMSDQHSNPIGSYKASCDYLVKVDGSASKKLESIIKMNRDIELSLQILYRDGTMRDYWPVWHKLQLEE